MEKRAINSGTERLDATDLGIRRAAAILRGGGLVAMPTETVYGLAANALDAVAIKRVFAAKQRPHWDPLIVHVSDRAMVNVVSSELSEGAARLAEAFWPGPLTLLLPRQSSLPSAVTAGRDLVGVRMPSHPVALQLIQAAGLPLAAPSANRFGHISPTTAQHVLADLDGRIDAVLDGGASAVGVESTVLDAAAGVIYRQGGVSQSQIEAALGQPVAVYTPAESVATPESLPSPGVGIRHYAPHARLLLVQDESSMRSQLAQYAMFRTGVMLPQDWTAPGFRGAVFPWERFNDPVALARTLYIGLRELDSCGVEVIVCPLPPSGSESLVAAIRDRLLKAAKHS